LSSHRFKVRRPARDSGEVVGCPLHELADYYFAFLHSSPGFKVSCYDSRLDSGCIFSVEEDVVCMNRIPVALFNSRTLAEPIQSRLSQAGIAAEIHDEPRLERLWFVSKPKAAVRLDVPSNQFERGEQLLVDWDAKEGALHDAIHCPECKSLLVEYPQIARRSVLTNLAMGLAAELGLVEKQYYCRECHFTWPREGKIPRPGRPNMAPYYFIEGVEQGHAYPSRSPTPA